MFLFPLTQKNNIDKIFIWPKKVTSLIYLKTIGFFVIIFYQLKNKTPLPCEDIGHVSIDIEVNKILVQLLDISKC